MGDIDTVVRYTRKIEKLLENLGAEGRGIHAMLDSLGDEIPHDLQQSLHYIATVRNNLIHEDGFEIIDINSFSNTCEKSIASLELLSTHEFTGFSSPPQESAPSQQNPTDPFPQSAKSDVRRPSRSAGSSSSWDWRDKFEMCWVLCWGLIRIVLTFPLCCFDQISCFFPK